MEVPTPSRAFFERVLEIYVQLSVSETILQKKKEGPLLKLSHRHIGTHVNILFHT